MSILRIAVVAPGWESVSVEVPDELWPRHHGSPADCAECRLVLPLLARSRQ